MTESFALGRIAALQPRMALEDLAEPVMGTEDPLIFNNLANVVRLWAAQRPDMPEDFVQRMNVTTVSRQPLVFITVDLQHVTRTLTQMDEPFAGGQYDAARWNTDDPFALKPIDPTVFPDTPQSDESFIPGQEEVRSCSDCEGAGEKPCTACGALGVVICPACNGSRTRICSRCAGAGSHMGISGRFIQCQICGGTGALNCQRCDNNGRVACTDCKGLSRVQCLSCAGHGNVRSRWLLITQTRTWTEQVPKLHEPWTFEVEKLFSESDPVFTKQWPWPTTSKPERPIERALPANLLEPAQQLISDSLRNAAEIDPARERITGLRLRLLATYVYQVDFDYHGHTGQVFVAGTRCRVFPGAIPTESTGLLRTIRRIGKRAVTALATDDRPGLDPAYVHAVMSGAAHISDQRHLLPAVAQSAGGHLEVTETGYRLLLNRKDAEIPIEIDLDVDDERTLTLCARHLFGPAHRDRNPDALALNQDLSFGRIAVVNAPDGRETFALVDRRPYDSISAETYSWIIRALADEARELRDRAALE